MSEQMPIKWPQQQMWTVSDDRRSARMHLPPLRLHGLAEPVSVVMEFDVETIDLMMNRLAEVRAEMLPPPPRH